MSDFTKLSNKEIDKAVADLMAARTGWRFNPSGTTGTGPLKNGRHPAFVQGFMPSGSWSDAMLAVKECMHGLELRLTLGAECSSRSACEALLAACETIGIRQRTDDNLREVFGT